MHILYALHGYKPAYRLGGPIHSVSAIAERLAAKGHKITVFATNNNLDETLDVPLRQPTELNGVEVWYFPTADYIKQYTKWIPYISQSIGYLYAPDMANVLRKLLPSVDIVHTQIPFIYPSRLAARLALEAGKPLFYNARGVYHPQRLQNRGLKKRAYIRLVEKPIMRRATGLIALTQNEVEDFHRLGVHRPCYVIPNGIELGCFRALPKSRILESFGIDDTENVVLFLGRLDRTKGVDIAVEAFLRNQGKHPRTSLVLAGPDEHNLTRMLRERISAAGADRRIVFAGHVSGEVKLDLLARANLFILPSLGEGLPMAALEALASGTPVLVSEGCNLPEVTLYGAGAVLNRTAEAFASAIDKFFTNPSLLQNASVRALQLANDQFSWTTAVDKLETLYNAAAAS